MDGLVTDRTDAARLILGSAQWGMRYGIANASGAPSDPELRAILDSARAAGVTTIDTARAYGDAGERIGALIDERDARQDRDEWHVITKLDPDVLRPDEDAERFLQRVAESVDASRAALRRPVLDTLLLHRVAHRSAHDGIGWRWLLDERRAGRVRRLGISAATPAQAEAALDDEDIEVIQVAASIADQRLVRAGFFDRAEARGVEVHVRSVFLQGALLLDAAALPPHLAPLHQVIEPLRDWADSTGVDTAAAALGYVRDLVGPASVRVVIGCESVAQLRANVAAWRNGPGRDGRRRIGPAALAADMPQLPDDVLDPARWPT